MATLDKSVCVCVCGWGGGGGGEGLRATRGGQINMSSELVTTYSYELVQLIDVFELSVAVEEECGVVSVSRAFLMQGLPGRPIVNIALHQVTQTDNFSKATNK